MLVIISDLHLTDDTTGKTINAGAFRDFRARLQELALDAAKRKSGRFQPPEAIELVLLGDIFDPLHSARWHMGEEDVRPWEHKSKPLRFQQKLAEITEAIISRNEEALAILQDLSGAHPLRLREPGRAGAAEISVPVNMTYMVGNHDWYYHLPGEGFEKIRERMRAVMGLANEPGPFPHEAEESARLFNLLRSHRTYARHGDKFDSFNYEEAQGRDAATLGDAIVVELVNRFPQEVRAQVADLPPAFVAGLDELSNVRPSLMIPVWVDALLRNAALTTRQENQVKEIWNALAEEFIALPFVQARDQPLSLDEVDGLELTLHLSTGFSFRGLARLATFVQERIWKGNLSYARHAVKEPAYEDPAFDHIVYGHTHHHELIPLRVRRHGGQPVTQFYLNSGTWHAIQQRTFSEGMVAPNFAFYHVMTYLAFFHEDERSGRPFETWSGTLGFRDHEPAGGD